MTFSTCLARALVALAFIAPPCLAADSTAERELANGLRVIVKTDTRPERGEDNVRVIGHNRGGRYAA